MHIFAIYKRLIVFQQTLYKNIVQTGLPGLTEKKNYRSDRLFWSDREVLSVYRFV